jgi:hypothetical protein
MSREIFHGQTSSPLLAPAPTEEVALGRPQPQASTTKKGQCALHFVLDIVMPMKYIRQVATVVRWHDRRLTT